MKLDRLVACGACALFAFALPTSMAYAQMGASGAQGQGCTDIQMLQHKCGQQNNKQQQQQQQAKKPSQYPNATRKEPSKLGVGRDEAKPLNEGLAAANSGDAATAQKDLQPIADNSSSKYAKALALLGLAQIKYNSGDTKGAIALQKQAIDLDSVDNDTYFQGLFALAQMYVADEDYSDALTTLDKWMDEGRKETADAYALKGNILYRLQKYPEAVASIKKAKSMTDKSQPSWDQIELASYFAMDKYDEAGKLAEAMLAKDPNNSKLMMNVVAIYMNSKQYSKALALLERARASGQIHDETTYVNMSKLYFNLAVGGTDTKENATKAAQVLEEGMSKGIVQPSKDNYKLLGDAYRLAGDTAKADAAYDKGGLPHTGSSHKRHTRKSKH
jgi:predicted Zn-dependent protease